MEYGHEVNRLNQDAAVAGTMAEYITNNILAYGSDPALENVTLILPIKSQNASIVIRTLTRLFNITPSMERPSYTFGYQSSHIMKEKITKMTPIGECIKYDPNLTKNTEGTNILDAMKKLAIAKMHLKTLLMGLTTLMNYNYLYIGLGPYDDHRQLGAFISMVNFSIGCVQKGYVQIDGCLRGGVSRINQSYSRLRNEKNMSDLPSTVGKIVFVTTSAYNHVQLNTEKNNKSADKNTIPKDYANTLEFKKDITFVCLSDSLGTSETPIEDMFSEREKGVYGTYAEYNPYNSRDKGTSLKSDHPAALTVYSSEPDDLTADIFLEQLCNGSGIFRNNGGLGGDLNEYLSSDKKASSSFFYKDVYDNHTKKIATRFLHLKNYKIVDNMGYLRYMVSTFKQNVLGDVKETPSFVNVTLTKEDSEKMDELKKLIKEKEQQAEDIEKKLDTQGIQENSKKELKQELLVVNQDRINAELELSELSSKFSSSTKSTNTNLDVICKFFSVDKRDVASVSFKGAPWNTNKIASFERQYNNLAEVDKQIIIAFLLSTINLELVLKMESNGVVHPFIFRFIRPHQTYTTQGLLIAAKGGVVGNTHVGFDSILKSPNTLDHTENISYQKHVAASVDRPDLMFIKKDIMISQYHRGLGTKICKKPKIETETPNYDAYVMAGVVGDFDKYLDKNMALNGVFEFESGIFSGVVQWKPKPWYFFNYRYKFSSLMTKNNLISFGTNAPRDSCLKIANVITEENYYCKGKYITGGITAYSRSFNDPESFRPFHTRIFAKDSLCQKGETIANFKK